MGNTSIGVCTSHIVVNFEQLYNISISFLTVFEHVLTFVVYVWPFLTYTVLYIYWVYTYILSGWTKCRQRVNNVWTTYGHICICLAKYDKMLTRWCREFKQNQSETKVRLKWDQSETKVRPKWDQKWDQKWTEITETSESRFWQFSQQHFDKLLTTCEHQIGPRYYKNIGNGSPAESIFHEVLSCCASGKQRLDCACVVGLGLLHFVIARCASLCALCVSCCLNVFYCTHRNSPRHKRYTNATYLLAAYQQNVVIFEQYCIKLSKKTWQKRDANVTQTWHSFFHNIDAKCGTLGAHIGCIRGSRVLTWGPLGCTWGSLWAPLGALGAHLVALGAHFGCTSAHLGLTSSAVCSSSHPKTPGPGTSYFLVQIICSSALPTSTHHNG